MLLYHKLLREQELADTAERPYDARDEPRRVTRSGVLPHFPPLRTQLLQAPLNSDEATDVLIARPPQADSPSGERHLPPRLSGGLIGTVEVSDELDEPEIVRRDREPHPASVPETLSRE